MTQPAPARITIGVDTHAEVHVAVAKDSFGRRLDATSVPTTRAGYAELLDWAQRLGQIQAWGIEGTGSFGAGLTRFLRSRGQVAVEVNRPDRAARRRRGKSDSEDVTGEDVRRGHRDGLTRSPTDQWVSCLGSVGHAGWPRRARTEQAP
jgi:transposase